jgi:hypothetical protein
VLVHVDVAAVALTTLTPLVWSARFGVVSIPVLLEDDDDDNNDDEEDDEVAAAGGRDFDVCVIVDRRGTIGDGAGIMTGPGGGNGTGRYDGVGVG